MVIRVLAGAVPMICGALIFTGVIPVGKWVMGSAAPNPAELIHTMEAADELARAQSRMAPGDSDIFSHVSPGQGTTLTLEQRAAFARQIDQARTRQLQARSHRGSSDGDTGWAPRGGWGR